VKAAAASAAIMLVAATGPMLATSAAEATGDHMSYREMADTMQMDDTARFGKALFDRLEWRNGDTGEGRGVWDGQAWYGGDYDKLWVKSEGKYVSSGRDTGFRDADVELLWSRVISRWWNLQGGGRQDFGPGQSRTWLSVGLEGLAPQWFETEATLYASDEGRTAARLKAQYDLLLTQRLVLQPFAEANLYGHSDRQHQLGSGLSDLEVSIRLRYELRRDFAPYIGVVWLRRFGETADLVRAAGGEASDLELAVGLRVWF
jgi:copper resistance protein B